MYLSFGDFCSLTLVFIGVLGLILTVINRKDK